MKTKAELMKKIAELESALEAEKKRPTGHTISDCHIDMSDDSGIAIAEAVKAGMDALKQIKSQPTYGVYFGSSDRSDHLTGD